MKIIWKRAMLMLKRPYYGTEMMSIKQMMFYHRYCSSGIKKRLNHFHQLSIRTNYDIYKTENMKNPRGDAWETNKSLLIDFI
jgi:hypothetical protein